MSKDLDERIRALCELRYPSFTDVWISEESGIPDMPAEVLHSGVKLIIINRGDTSFDSYTHLRFFKEIGDLLPPAVGLLKQLMGLGDRERTRNPRLVGGEPR